METIAAIATPLGEGGISVIRISGERALGIAERVFSPVSGRSVGELSGYTAAYGEIHDGGTRLDDGVLLVFRAPHSYTGEDTAEISCHGGIFVTKRVLSACFAAGAVPAQAGEFTKRALLNGKLSLTQAEAVSDLISAQNETFLLCGRAQREGALYRRIKGISEKLLSLVTLIQAWIDYPDEMEDDFDGALESERLRTVISELEGLLESYDEGRLLRDGIPCAIVGRPNAGKSTLMNLLSGAEKSIVTDIEGTTRDIVEETVNLGGIMLRLSDCAGIRGTKDIVERIGVEKMLGRIEQSALIFAVFDGSRPFSPDDGELIERISGKNVICLVNKNDLPQVFDRKRLTDSFDCVLEISAKDEQTKQKLKEAVEKKAGIGTLRPEAGFIANERQRKCVKEAIENVKAANEALCSGVTLDAVGIMCENALERLYELSGENVSEAVIDEVFRNFCVGK